MTNAEQKTLKRSSRQMRRRRSMRRDRSWIWLLGGAAIITVVLIVLLLSPQPDPAAIPGVIAYSDLPRQHTEAPQAYAQIPPVGGMHSGIWQNCGIYDQPIRNENAVHSMEHGAVWITYQPDLPADAIEHLRTLVRGKDYVLISPYPGLPKPVVASAWGLQLSVDNANDSRLPLFIARYAQGPQTPERGAVCSGGIGTPVGN